MTLRWSDPVTRSAVVCGVGIGGLADGIVLHQVLQWHHLISDDTSAQTVAGLEKNTLADGVFHLAVLVVLIIGGAMLVRAVSDTKSAWGRLAGGGLLLGWGVFNLVDEAVFHLALDLHHIRMVDDYVWYDVGFTLMGVVLILLGLRLLNGASNEVRPGAAG